MNLDTFASGAYLEFYLISYNESLKLAEVNVGKDQKPDTGEIKTSANKAFALLKEKFVGGKLPDDKGELVDVLVDDLAELPMALVTECVRFLGSSSQQS